MPTYPFQRANSGGYLTGERFPSADANTIDANAAAAADGTLYSDLAMVSTIVATASAGDCGLALLATKYTNAAGRVAKIWFTFGVNAGNPTVRWSYPTDAWVNNVSAMPAGDGLTPVHGAVAASPLYAIMGGTPGIASTSKIRRRDLSISGVDPWDEADTVAAGTEAVNCAVWHSGASLFVIGLSNTAATNIETSPTGATWTQRTGLPNTNARSAIASNGTIVVVMSDTSTNKCIRSTDCATWTEGTLPASAAWRSVVWDSVNEFFVANSTSGDVATSTDGTTWTSRVVATDGMSATKCVCVGRMIVGPTGSPDEMDVCYFERDLTFRFTTIAVGGAAFASVGASDNQIAFAISGSTHYKTFCGGFAV